MYISSVSLPVNEPNQTLISLRQSILCGYDSGTFFFGWGGGLPGMPHSFVKDFSLGISVVILDGASIVCILTGVGASTVQ